MTVYSLMSGQTLPTNVPLAPQPASVVLTGNPTRGTLTFALSRKSGSYAQGSLWGTIGVNYLGYAEVVQVMTMAIPAGEAPLATQTLGLPVFQNYFALLDEIEGGQKVAASMTLVV